MIVEHKVIARDSFAVGFTVTITLQSNVELDALIAALDLNRNDPTRRLMYDRLRRVRLANTDHHAQGFKDRKDSR